MSFACICFLLYIFSVVAGANFPTTTLCKNGVPREIRSDGKYNISKLCADGKYK